MHPETNIGFTHASLASTSMTNPPPNANLSGVRFGHRRAHRRRGALRVHRHPRALAGGVDRGLLHVPGHRRLRSARRATPTRTSPSPRPRSTAPGGFLLRASSGRCAITSREAPHHAKDPVLPRLPGDRGGLLQRLAARDADPPGPPTPAAPARTHAGQPRPAAPIPTGAGGQGTTVTKTPVCSPDGTGCTVAPPEAAARSSATATSAAPPRAPPRLPLRHRELLRHRRHPPREAPDLLHPRRRHLRHQLRLLRQRPNCNLSQCELGSDDGGRGSHDGGPSERGPPNPPPPPPDVELLELVEEVPQTPPDLRVNP